MGTWLAEELVISEKEFQGKDAGWLLWLLPVECLVMDLNVATSGFESRRIDRRISG